jgi:hypothetical protein
MLELGDVGALVDGADVAFEGCITRFTSCSPVSSQRSTARMKKLQSTSVLHIVSHEIRRTLHILNFMAGFSVIYK